MNKYNLILLLAAVSIIPGHADDSLVYGESFDVAGATRSIEAFGWEAYAGPYAENVGLGNKIMEPGNEGKFNVPGQKGFGDADGYIARSGGGDAEALLFTSSITPTFLPSIGQISLYFSTSSPNANWMRFAIRIGDAWYVSLKKYKAVKKNVWEKITLDVDPGETEWLPLSFIPDEHMILNNSIENKLEEKKVAAFGLYIHNKSIVRFDEFKISISKNK